MTCCRPLFERQANIDLAYPVYLKAEMKDGDLELSAYTARHTGKSPDEWHNIVMTWRIDPGITEAHLERLFTAVRPDIEKIFEMTEVAWDGSNWKRKLNDDALSLTVDIEQKCLDFGQDDISEPCGDENCEYCEYS